MLHVEHVVEFCARNLWPNYDFFPICEATTVVKRRDWELVVHMLELLLRREGLLYQVAVETAEPKDEYAKQGRNECSNDAPPVA